MSREEEVQFEQDRLGNENRKLDTLRAAEGMAGASSEDGIVEIDSAVSGSVQVLYSFPTHADRVFAQELHAHNSTGTAGSYSLYEVTLDGAGSITSSERRSVPISVASISTRINSYLGLEFDKAIGVDADFEGWVGVGLIVDHDEQNEPQSENY